VDETPARKLAELLESAPSDDRRAITAWLLEQRPEPAVAGAVPAGLLAGLRGAPLGSLGLAEQGGDALTGPGEWISTHHVERLRGVLSPGKDSQLVTLRLPADRHAELRRWCSEHDFSMAAVIRGLVEQFLEARGAAGADPA
jgi:hypothetical protein